MKNKTKTPLNQSKSLSAEEVVGLIPDELLDQLSLETDVDSFVKKFHGKVVFKLFIYAMLTTKTISLRILETIFSSPRFQRLFKVPQKKLTHAGIAYRLKTMDVTYLERIFSHLISSHAVDEILFADKKVNIRKIDTTIVTLSSKLLKLGMDRDKTKKTLKFGVELNQGIPVNLMLCTEQRDCSEDNVLPRLVRHKSGKQSAGALNIAIFDRGIQRKKTFVDFEKESILFISRSRSQKFKVLEDKVVPPEETESETIRITSDQAVIFSNTYATFDEPLRLVTGVNKETGQTISFLTNVTFLSAKEITELYRSRWEIETFFKFIKQELNFSHLLSRSENGIKVCMYLTMIVAILMTIYKKTNKIVGWASTKIKFLDELEHDLLIAWNETLAPMFQAERQKRAAVKGG